MAWLEQYHLRLWMNDASLTEIDLRGKRIGAKGAVKLAKAMKGNKTVQTLLLCNSQIGDEGAIALAKIFQGNETLQTLDLRCNGIGEEGATALAVAFRDNETLQELVLCLNEIGDEGASALAEAFRENKTLQTLDLSNNEIGDEGARAFAEAFQDNEALQTLSLAWNQIGDEGATALANGLGGNTVLQSLNLCNNRIGSNGAMGLATALMVNRTLKRLKLFYQLPGEPSNERVWTRQSYQAFLDMSYDNFGVQVDIHLPPDDANALDDEELRLTILDMLTQLRLNACGRGRLEEAPSKENSNVPVVRARGSARDWTDVLLDVHDIEDVPPWCIKLDCIYTLLRKNPNMCPKSDK